LPPGRVTIEVDLSPEGLLQARDAIDRLLAEQERPASVSTGHIRLGQAQRKVDEVWSRVGGKTRELLSAAASNWEEGEEFTMEDVALALDVPPQTVRSWRRNLGRTLRRVDEAMPEPPVLVSRSNGPKNLYRLPPEVRQAILART
jgi:transposase-like protein